MIFNLLPLLSLLSLTVASPEWAPPNTCISRFLKKPITPLISAETINSIPKDLQKGLRLLQKEVNINEQQINAYVDEIDDLITRIFASRANTLTHSNEYFKLETQLIGQIFRKAYDNCLTNGRNKNDPGKIKMGNLPTETLKTHDIMKKYKTCIRDFQGEKHVERLKNEVVKGISGVKTAEQLEEFRARLVSAARADFANAHAHRMRCFMTTHQGVKFHERTEPSSIKRMVTWASTEKKELEKELRNLDTNLAEAHRELADWKKRQIEIVRHLFDDLLKQRSKTNVLQSQEDRLNALILMAGMEKIDAEKAKEQFLIFRDSADKLHPNVHEMVVEYLKCVNNEKPQTFLEVRSDVAHAVHNLLSNNHKKSELAIERAALEYFWERHLFSIELDFATEMAESVECYVKTERKIFS